MYFKILFFLTLTICSSILKAQQWNSAQILHEMQKLQVNGSVLYVAAHPDDENTRLLTYLANERKYRTGYLSLTRGDGGQNLIGNEQGVELGLIRTQELLAARRMDGAEQFFTSAYDFGFSKTSAESFAIWDKQKILADVVWVIRKFKPDVIIARFPEDTRAGHGHHAASGILAREAFAAAADRNQFTEQFAKGVTTWQAKRILWNTFNFGGANTTNESQLKIDVGAYNSLLGKSYGELAALSRSQHKSQGFGVPSQRGSQIEYFTVVAGDSMQTDIMDGVNTTINRYAKDQVPQMVLSDIENNLKQIIANYVFSNPQNSIPALLQLYKKINNQPYTENKEYMTHKLKTIISNCMGLYLEATTSNAYAVLGDSLKINFSVNARLQDSVLLKNIFYKKRNFNTSSWLSKNKNFTASKTILIANEEALTQPFWLVRPLENGRFSINDQNKIGNADVDYEKLNFVLELDGELFIYDVPLQYKYTDPVKGEIFQPVYIVPNVDVEVSQNVVLKTKLLSNDFNINILPRKSFAKADYIVNGNTSNQRCDTIYSDYVYKDSLQKNKKYSFPIKQHNYSQPACSGALQYVFSNNKLGVQAFQHLRSISYDHIPSIVYFQKPTVHFVYDNVITHSKKVGYINGAGDKVVDALKQLGYTVDILGQTDITPDNIKKYDAIITGIRAYNTNEWMNEVYEVLMQYIKNGGNLIVQYNTSNQIGPVKAKIGPYPFTISRNRVTEEKALVRIINPAELVLNKPNVIRNTDFNNWVQERSIYEATEVDSNFRKVFMMNDTNEKETDGSLIIAPYSKGNFVYCSVVLFRELPAGVAGAYKLLANMVELPNNSNGK
jgi:LmbE family N-acetylglucosaminyl deacetylase